MILTMTRMFDMRGGRYSILSDGTLTWWVMEREWLLNRRNESCVPRDEYTLEPHRSAKYPDTWAFIGDAVSHYSKAGIPRFACVMHKAIYPSSLEGCFTPCVSIGATGEAVDAPRAMSEVRELFKKAAEPIKVLMQ